MLCQQHLKCKKLLFHYFNNTVHNNHAFEHVFVWWYKWCFSDGVWSCLVTLASVTQLSQHAVDPKQQIELCLLVCGQNGATEVFQLDKLQPLVLGQIEEYKVSENIKKFLIILNCWGLMVKTKTGWIDDYFLPICNILRLTWSSKLWTVSSIRLFTAPRAWSLVILGR